MPKKSDVIELAYLGISTPASAQACITVVPAGTSTGISSTNTSTRGGPLLLALTENVEDILQYYLYIYKTKACHT